MRKTISLLKAEQEVESKKSKRPNDRAKAKKKEELLVHFSSISVAKATLVVIGLVLLTNFLGEIADIVIVFFVSVLFSAALDPTVKFLEKYKIPRSISVIGIFIVLLSGLVFFISKLVPLMASQIIELASNLGGLISNLTNGEATFLFGQTLQSLLSDALGSADSELILQQVSENLESLGAQLQSIAGDTFSAIKNIFDGILNFFMVLVLTFFLIVDEKGVDRFFISLFPSKHGAYIIEKTEAVKNKVGLWLRGQMILMVIMFFMSWIAYSLLGLDYALTLAMLAGVGELIPVVGFFIAAIPALLVAFNHSPWLLLWAFITLMIIQQLEGNVLVPMVMRKAVGLSPIIVILAMLVGYQLLGILGMIVAVPVATILSIFVLDYTMKKK
ncbi:MAG: putative PurR-regulated permease PerM [Oceanicoccus sp.]|jgi:predicted PurR-regulated permease PerM